MTARRPPFDYEARPHRRYDALAGEWLLVSPGRTQRPWQGDLEAVPDDERLRYDPGCPLCPGNRRAGGVRNPDYGGTFVFTNDFAALGPDGPVLVDDGEPLLRAETASGTCRVICFSPRHDLSLASMVPEKVESVVDLWAAQVDGLAAEHAWVQVFENRGAEMGASNPHPHGQVWATSAVPGIVAREDATQRRHHADSGSLLLADYLDRELAAGLRVVVDTADWNAVVPFWAAWPYETLLVPKAPVSRLPDLDPTQRAGLATALAELLARYDNLFRRPFPYSMGWHGAPGTAAAPHWQLHAHFYPPLLGPQKRKFMVGYELLAELQRDLTPEAAAAHLRAVPAVHHARAGT